MKRITGIILMLLVLTNIANAQKQTINKSTVSFAIKNLGIAVNGTFGGLQGDINFSKDKPDSGTIQATIDAATINTDNGMRDKHLKSEDFFDVEKYPRISMKSVAIKQKSGNNYLGTFSLTIKDKTQTVEVPFTFVAAGNSGVFKGSFKIKRTDFGVGGKSMVMSNDVAINLNVETTLN